MTKIALVCFKKKLLSEGNCIFCVCQGQLKVVRLQSVVDAAMSNESKFTAARTENIGMGKYFSHANSKILRIYSIAC